MEMLTNRLGIEFKDTEGKRILIHPDEIRFIEEIEGNVLQITTSQWIKTYRNVKYEDVIAAIRDYDALAQRTFIRPWQDLADNLLKKLAEKTEGK
jgi:hypothetical protein